MITAKSHLYSPYLWGTRAGMAAKILNFLQTNRIMDTAGFDENPSP